ncbi:hypothetical protein [Nocardioides litoris]|nr:hypothetical protein [Nocardioides litoris]
MTVLLVLLGLLAWCLVPLPLAVLVGRVLAAGHGTRGLRRQDLELCS